MCHVPILYLDSRNFGDAIPLFERAAGIEPENAALHLNLGIAYRGAQRYEESSKNRKRSSSWSVRIPSLTELGHSHARSQAIDDR